MPGSAHGVDRLRELRYYVVEVFGDGMVIVIAEQRKIIERQYLYLRLSALRADNGGIAVAIQVLHEIGVDAYAVFKQLVVEVQPAVEGDKVILRTLETVHLGIEIIDHPEQLSAMHDVLVYFQLLFISKFLSWLYDYHCAEDGRNGGETVNIKNAESIVAAQVVGEVIDVFRKRFAVADKIAHQRDGILHKGMNGAGEFIFEGSFHAVDGTLVESRVLSCQQVHRQYSFFIREQGAGHYLPLFRFVALFGLGIDGIRLDAQTGNGIEQPGFGGIGQPFAGFFKHNVEIAAAGFFKLLQYFLCTVAQFFKGSGEIAVEENFYIYLAVEVAQHFPGGGRQGESFFGGKVRTEVNKGGYYIHQHEGRQRRYPSVFCYSSFFHPRLMRFYCGLRVCV